MGGGEWEGWEEEFEYNFPVGIACRMLMSKAWLRFQSINIILYLMASGELSNTFINRNFMDFRCRILNIQSHAGCARNGDRGARKSYWNIFDDVMTNQTIIRGSMHAPIHTLLGIRIRVQYRRCGRLFKNMYRRTIPHFVYRIESAWVIAYANEGQSL